MRICFALLNILESLCFLQALFRRNFKFLFLEALRFVCPDFSKRNVLCL